MSDVRVLIVDDQLRTIATIRLGEYSYQAEGVAAIRAAGCQCR